MPPSRPGVTFNCDAPEIKRVDGRRFSVKITRPNHRFPGEYVLSGVPYLKNFIFQNDKFFIDIGRFQQCFKQMHPYSTICGGSPN